VKTDTRENWGKLSKYHRLDSLVFYNLLSYFRGARFASASAYPISCASKMGFLTPIRARVFSLYG
jgi:hypothetical protein